MMRHSRTRVVVGTAALACAAGLLSLAHAATFHAGGHAHGATSITVTISVRATQPWTDTGIDLTPGAAVSIMAGGTIAFNPALPSATPAGSRRCMFDETYIAPNLPCSSLIARIGSGLPFEAGTARQFTARVAGRLALGVNDSYFGDNNGTWTATVKIRS